MTFPTDNRRNFLMAATSAASVCLADLFAHRRPSLAAGPRPGDAAARIRYCLNTSTINGSKLDMMEQVRIAAQAGYDAIEPWVRDVERFEESGGSLKDLRKAIGDAGLKVDSGIAFGNWIVDDPQQRREGLDRCRRDMAKLAAIGGLRIAAPPAGATRGKKLDLDQMAQRYAALLEVGRQEGVVPQLELWGFSTNLSSLAEVLYVAAAARDADACLLLDIYHMYKGGSDFQNIGLVPGAKMFCLHMNDYPAQPPRDRIQDKDRVYPGDGVAPIDKILRTLVRSGFSGTLSLELFNRSYWELPPDTVARTGLEKMRERVRAALEAE